MLIPSLYSITIILKMGNKTAAKKETTVKQVSMLKTVACQMLILEIVTYQGQI